MSAQPTEVPGQPQVIRVTGEAAVVPMAEYRRLKAIERHAPAGVIAEAEAEEAEIAGILEEHRQWVADGRPGGASQDEMEQAFADGNSQ